MWVGKFKIYKDIDCQISTNQCWVMIDYYQYYLYSGDTLFKLFKEIIFYWRHDRNLVG